MHETASSFLRNLSPKIRQLFQRPGLQPLLEKRFWRASGLLLLANLLVALLGLLRTPAITWLIPKDQVGMLGVVAAWFPFIQLASLPGLDSAAYHYLAQGYRWAFRSAITERLKWSLLSALILVLLGISFAGHAQPALAWLFVIAGLSFPVTNGLSLAASTLAAQEKYGRLFWYRLWESLTDFTGFLPLLLGVVWLNQIATFYLANQLATAVMMVTYSLILWQQLNQPRALAQPSSELPPGEPAEMKRYGRHLSAIAGIGVLQSRTDTLLVSALQALETVADYNIANLVYEQIKRLWGIYVTVRYPPLVRLPLPQRRRQLLLEGGLVWLTFGLICLGMSLLGHWLIPLLLPPAYRSSLQYLDLFSLAMALSIPGGLAEIFFRTQQDERRQYILRAVSTGVGVAAPALLIFFWGAFGAAVGRLLANLAFSLTGVWLFFRDVKWSKP